MAGPTLFLMLTVFFVVAFFVVAVAPVIYLSQLDGTIPDGQERGVDDSPPGETPEPTNSNNPYEPSRVSTPTYLCAAE